MKGNRPLITLLGNNSGRNLGDAAILSSILESLSKEIPEAKFYVPSIAPKWISKHYGEHYNVKPLDAMPWTGSIRLLGIPTLWAIAKSDVALICDGIIFGKKLFNPAFNYLITLIFLVPWAALFKTKVVCYSCGIGPFPSFISRLFAKWVINGSDIVLMRENDSKALAEKIGVKKPITVTGDAAFINPVSSDSRAVRIASAEGIDLNTPILGLNVTKYIDEWLPNDQRVANRETFLHMLADGVKSAKASVEEAFQVIIFCTSPMDDAFCNQLAELLDATVIDNSRYLSHDIQAVMRRCSLFIGMRFHSVVLASAVEAPVIGLIYAPKVRGFMRLLECENYGLELAELTPEKLAKTLATAWKEREQLRSKQKKVIDILKNGAHEAARLIATRYFPSQAVEEVARAA